MTVWLPMGLGLVVLVTGGGVVLHARSLERASPPMERGGDGLRTSSRMSALLRTPSGRFGGAVPAIWCGVGAIVAGVFLIVVSAVSIIGG